MTTNTPRTDTAPETARAITASDEQKTVFCKGCKQNRKWPCASTRCDVLAGFDVQTSPSTGGDATIKESSIVAGGEPATDSAGREPLDVEFKRLAETILQATTNGTRLEALRGIAELFDKCAAREPAPVARELDVEAERRAFQVAFPIPDGVEWDGHYGNDKYISRYQMHEVFEYNLRWSGWLAARQSTAESAPASAAPGEWISVEDEIKPKGRTPILVAVSFVRFGEYEDGTPGEWPGQIVAEGEYVPQHGEVGNYFTCYSSPHGDQEGITHWMPLPAAPSNSSPVGAKE